LPNLTVVTHLLTSLSNHF